MQIAELRDEIISSKAQAAFDVLVERFSAHPDYELLAHEQGFLNSLRILRGEEFCFAAVPNDEWVLAYIRKPELRRGKLTVEAAMAEFAQARLTKAGEVTLRLSDADMADRWLAFVLQET
ncbi:hypothetical protein Q9295_05090 [Xinfangfangia sp. CPCC 101601]|uniref:Uncharacterized protein n=1 Tax=Pseudogemmobacter lacusdianii TaxID=3069608 RepID=A0ABU0VVG5_9RHOB|nr:hypothetical protein [Xinfangfangia sp. CPCC 101601]MDQ2065736.1 hypothetical protein [Xinfangfangia sp. CPCC 101601]